MKLLILTIIPSLLFGQAYCCFSFNALPKTKEGICAELPPIIERFPQEPIIRNLVEFCESDAVGPFSTNYLCQDLQPLISMPSMSSAVANDLTEFCNPDSPILRNELRQRGQNANQIGIYGQSDEENPENPETQENPENPENLDIRIFGRGRQPDTARCCSKKCSSRKLYY